MVVTRYEMTKSRYEMTKVGTKWPGYEMNGKKDNVFENVFGNVLIT